MGRGEGTLGRGGKGSAATAAGAGAGAGPSGSFATADAALKNKVKTMEEVDEQRKLARAAERDLQERLQRELDGEGARPDGRGPGARAILTAQESRPPPPELSDTRATLLTSIQCTPSPTITTTTRPPSPLPPLPLPHPQHRS